MSVRRLVPLHAFLTTELGATFNRESMFAARTIAKVIDGAALNDAELELFKKCTGRTEYTAGPVDELWLLVGRRAGKTLLEAAIAVWLAFCHDYNAVLAPGERATIALVAADRRQARTLFRYVRGFVAAVPVFEKAVVRETSSEVDLEHNVTLEVHTANFRSLRGYSFGGFCADEVAYWRSDDSANPDREIFAAEEAARATTGGMRIVCTSLHQQTGVVFDAHRLHYGKNGDPVLIFQTDSKTLNPTLSDRTIAEAYERDPDVAAAEWGGVFRRGLHSYVDREKVLACIEPGVTVRPPVPDVAYHAFVDMSGGQVDDAVLAIGHAQDSRTILDCLAMKPAPHSPDECVREFADILHSYGVGRVTGDRYGGEWPREKFREYGVGYELSPMTRSELYKALLPQISSSTCELLDVRKLEVQLSNLQRRVSPGGRDSIDHPAGSHDDAANAAAGVLVGLAKPKQYAGTIPVEGF